jgi:WNK lysine deficient protein kinase
VFIDSVSGTVKLNLLNSNMIQFVTSDLNFPCELPFIPQEFWDGIQMSSETDVWQFGMCLLELATNQIPYEEYPELIKLVKAHISKTHPAALQSVDNMPLKEIISSCLSFEPSGRPTIEDLKAHEFLNSSEDSKQSPELSTKN